MIFIIGGEGSGQEEYAKEHYPGARVIGAYHKQVKKQLLEGHDPIQCARDLLAEHDGGSEPLVVWSHEIGCGLVPTDAKDREWREVSGRVNCLFAAEAERVVRTVCGIGSVIKSENASAIRPDTIRAETENPSGQNANGSRKARSIMITGTMSNAGKSFVAAGLCRIFTEDGYRVAPFKAQNMALNSFITKKGEEMGRSQVVQAEACRREPDARMNPILLKPTTDRGSQIIVLGHPVADMDAKEYYRRKCEFLPAVKEAYDSLASENDIIVLEGAGSPAEINLKENDIVNMPMAAMADAPVILVGNIDPGGVFAQLYGTVKLLDEDEQNRIGGLIINKFRGDLSILEPGVAMLEEKTGKPVLGVLPYADVRLEPEDSLASEEAERMRKLNRKKEPLLDIAVIRFPKISNMTDFEALALEEDVEVRYVSALRELGTPDAVILPGTKSTIRDLIWLRESGLETGIRRAHARGAFLIGICGGYQMLGRKILDPDGAEMRGETDGLGYLDMETLFSPEKIMHQTETISDFGIPALDGRKITGYEVHMGRAAGAAGAALSAESPKNVIGTYIHGLFDEEDFRDAFVTYLFLRKGRKRGTPASDSRMTYREFKEKQLTDLAAVMRDHLDMDSIYRMMGLPGPVFSDAGR